MKNLTGIKFIIIITIFFNVINCTKHKPDNHSQQAKIIGVKIYEYKGNYPELFEKWDELGINTAFVSASLDSNQEFKQLVKEYNIKDFIILPTFYNPEVLAKHPDWYAITDKGQKAIDDWVHFVCPTRKEFREQHINYVKNIVRELKPDGISIDFIRNFAFWEMIYPDRKLNSIPNTCFCANCMKQFQAETEIEIPKIYKTDAAIAEWIKKNHLQIWVDWKCEIITSMVKNIVAEVKKIQPEILVNLHAVPWRKDDFDGAIKIITSQDFVELVKHVDYISPMCYHHMVKQETPWIHSVVQDIYEQTNSEILPSIQVTKAYLDNELSPEVFKEALKEALKPPSRGVIFWNWQALDSSPKKKGIAKTLINLVNQYN